MTQATLRESGAGLQSAARSLREERKRLEARIADVDSALRGIEQVVGQPEKKWGRPRWTAAQRAHLSKVQRKIWAKRKKRAQSTK